MKGAEGKVFQPFEIAIFKAYDYGYSDDPLDNKLIVIILRSRNAILKTAEVFVGKTLSKVRVPYKFLEKL